MVEIYALLLILLAVSSVLYIRPLPYPGEEEDRLLPPGTERKIGHHLCRWDGDCWQVQPAPSYEWDPDLCMWVEHEERMQD